MVKIEQYKKAKLVEYCKSIGLETTGKGENILTQIADKRTPEYENK